MTLRFSSDTRAGRLFNTSETVVTDTPAAAATSFSVARYAIQTPLKRLSLQHKYHANLTRPASQQQTNSFHSKIIRTISTGKSFLGSVFCILATFVQNERRTRRKKPAMRPTTQKNNVRQRKTIAIVAVIAVVAIAPTKRYERSRSPSVRRNSIRLRCLTPSRCIGSWSKLNRYFGYPSASFVNGRNSRSSTLGSCTLIDTCT